MPTRRPGGIRRRLPPSRQHARILYDAARYGACIYTVGVAVECILRAWRLRDRAMLAGIKGDALKENARIVLENGYDIVNLGVARWKNA